MTLDIRPTDTVEPSPATRGERVRQHLVTTRAAAVAVTRRQAWSAWRVIRQLPGAAGLLVRWAPRGAWRAVTAWVRYLRDEASDELRSHHAQQNAAGDYVKVAAVRSSNLRARLIANGIAVTLALALILAWTAPDVLAIFAGVAVTGVVIRVLPWRSWAEELAIAAGLGLGTWYVTPWAASHIPRPPTWAFWVAGVAAVLGCGWAGRPQARPLVTLPGVEQGGRVPPLTAPMVTAALCALGNGKMRDPDSVRLLVDPHRDGPGVSVEFELPAGVPASWVVERREELAGALRRELGCVWPSVGKRHPNHFVLYVCPEPMSEQVQEPWPLLRAGATIDLGEPFPAFTDQRGNWVRITLAYAAVIIGAVPRMGKTFALRQLLLAAGLDPTARVYAFDGKGTGDLAACRPFAHCYVRFGQNDQEAKIAKVLGAVREVLAEMGRRADVIDSLPASECPDSKVTSELIRNRPDLDLGWIVFGMDETQMFFGYGQKRNKEHQVIREEIRDGCIEIAKLGPALGIIPIYATQQVKEATIPVDISMNAVIRFCLKMEAWEPNDRVLGTGMYKRGIDAQMFDFSDKGIGYLKADGAIPIIARTVFGLDGKVAERLGVRAKALRAGRLTGDAADEDGIEDAVVVLDEPADVREVLGRRGTHAAHLAELVEWLPELRPDYAGMDVEELGKRLRNRGMTVGQVWVRSANRQGVDLRKQGAS